VGRWAPVGGAFAPVGSTFPSQQKWAELPRVKDAEGAAGSLGAEAAGEGAGAAAQVAGHEVSNQCGGRRSHTPMREPYREKEKNVEGAAGEAAGEPAQDDVFVILRRRAMDGRGREGEPTLITRDCIAAYSHLPMGVACAELGISSKALKRACRKLGIENWPYRDKEKNVEGAAGAAAEGAGHGASNQVVRETRCESAKRGRLVASEDMAPQKRRALLSDSYHDGEAEEVVEAVEEKEGQVGEDLGSGAQGAGEEVEAVVSLLEGAASPAPPRALGFPHEAPSEAPPAAIRDACVTPGAPRSAGDRIAAADAGMSRVDPIVEL
jgi:hypothetical protein